MICNVSHHRPVRRLRRTARALLTAVILLTCSVRAPAVVVEAEFQVPAEAFDQWVFQKVGSSRVARIHLLDLLEVRIAAVDAACRLTEDQQRKLTLAGRIDVRQLFDRIEGIRDEFLVVRRDQEAFNKAKIWDRTAPLQAAIAGGVFGRGSLYQKVLVSTLAADQQTCWQEVHAERRRYAYEAKIRLTLVALQQSLPLTEDQRNRLVELLLMQTPPPLRVGPYEQHYVLYQFGQLETRDLARLLTLSQLRGLRRHVRSFPEAQRNFLDEQGLLPGNEASSPAAQAELPLTSADDQTMREIARQVASEEGLP